MAKVHVLNVSPGDCTIIEHNSGRFTAIDICCGNLDTRQEVAEMAASASAFAPKPKGDYRMRERPTNPINYMKSFGIDRLFRFVLSHPDMDHMDGLANLHKKVGFTNFWHTGYRREKPPFGGTRFHEEDWDFYQSLIDGKNNGATVIEKLAGARFALANQENDAGTSPDALYIRAPDEALLADDVGDDVNESSFVLQYQSGAGAMIFPGDAHDVSWNLVMKNYPSLKGNCAFLLAPHHGRDSDRSYEFLDFLRPKLTVLGVAPSKFLAYEEWARRGLLTITSNQAGNVVLDVQTGFYDVYIENREYARDCGCDLSKQNAQNYYLWKRIVSK
jgi:competence protein ComEC